MRGRKIFRGLSVLQRARCPRGQLYFCCLPKSSFQHPFEGCGKKALRLPSYTLAEKVGRTDRRAIAEEPGAIATENLSKQCENLDNGRLIACCPGEGRTGRTLRSSSGPTHRLSSILSTGALVQRTVLKLSFLLFHCLFVLSAADSV